MAGSYAVTSTGAWDEPWAMEQTARRLMRPLWTLDREQTLQQYADMGAKMTRQQYNKLLEASVDVTQEPMAWDMGKSVLHAPEEVGKIIEPPPVPSPHDILVPPIERRAPKLIGRAGSPLGTCPDCRFVGLVDEECPVCVGRCSFCTKHPCGHERRWASRAVIGAMAGRANEVIFNVERDDGFVCGGRPWGAWEGNNAFRTWCGVDLDFNTDSVLPDWTLKPVNCLVCMEDTQNE